MRPQIWGCGEGVGLPRHFELFTCDGPEGSSPNWGRVESSESGDLGSIHVEVRHSLWLEAERQSVGRHSYQGSVGSSLARFLRSSPTTRHVEKKGRLHCHQIDHSGGICQKRRTPLRLLFSYKGFSNAPKRLGHKYCACWGGCLCDLVRQKPVWGLDKPLNILGKTIRLGAPKRCVKRLGWRAVLHAGVQFMWGPLECGRRGPS